MTETFLTIKKAGSHEIDIKKSRFICNMQRIETEEQAKQLIQTISKANEKANHNCFAYMLGDTDQIQRESDNGEPSGTAGVPILEVLKKNELHNVIAVVTRYFGGIKLGAGGLIRAYSNATSTTIDTLGIVNLVTKKELFLTIDYNQFDKLKYFLSSNNVPIETVGYTDKIKVTIAVEESGIPKFIQAIKDLLSDQFNYATGLNKVFEVPFSRQERQQEEHE
ncbi:YigZ family protein [Lentilactobacillus kisonensis]|uniref:YigZ family protein n=2 Tax=Lentilactobacillus kisonensis TaxID=481722 RepID=A0A0R1NS70_9LACO|nr:YigZ family protein [Lentilactobacillus kisonensis]KRL20482.1 YigZ family protein [Lentilactobacillus kisonensis DSM 19906 = JCM 15041]